MCENSYICARANAERKDRGGDSQKGSQRGRIKKKETFLQKETKVRQVTSGLGQMQLWGWNGKSGGLIEYCRVCNIKVFYVMTVLVSGLSKMEARLDLCDDLFQSSWVLRQHGCLLYSPAKQFYVFGTCWRWLILHTRDLTHADWPGIKHSALILLQKQTKTQTLNFSEEGWKDIPQGWGINRLSAFHCL